MKKRRNYIVDREFQLKTTFTIISAVSIITALIVGVIAAGVVSNNRKIENIYKIENGIVSFLTSLPGGAASQAQKQAMIDIESNHSKNMKTLNKMITHNRILLYVLVAFIIIQGIVLYIILIHKTHKIAGPIYVMSQYMKDIIDGRTPAPRELRHGDELQNFYDLFKEMVKKITPGSDS